MITNLKRVWLPVITAISWAIMMLSIQSAAASPVADAQSLSPALRTFLQRYSGPDEPTLKPTKVSVASVTTEAGAQEIVVFFREGGWCGEDGGCYLLVLEPYKKSFRVIGRTPNTNLPIRGLGTFSYGKPDIGIWCEGYGVPHPYEARMRFDGRKYPGSLVGSRWVTKTKKGEAGNILLSKESTFELLYK